MDTLGLTKNKPLKKLTKQDKAFIEINRKNVLESQKKVTPKEVNKILKFIKKATKAGPSGYGGMASGSSARQAGIREINPMRYPVVPKYKQGGFTSYFNGGIVAVKGVNKLTGKRYGR